MKTNQEILQEKIEGFIADAEWLKYEIETQATLLSDGSGVESKLWNAGGSLSDVIADLEESLKQNSLNFVR